jgi:alkylation response protein AidB-like acyl-CoA dehydrogenase
LGTTGLLVPSEYDGAGMTMVEAGIVLEELGAGLHPGPWLSTAVAASRALTRLDVDASVAAPIFSGIANGSTTVAVGPLDGDRPSAAASGGGVVLRGEIDGVWDVAAADLILVLADDRDGTGLFAVQTSAPSIDITPQTGIDQTRKRFRLLLNETPAQRLSAAPPDSVEALVDDVTIAWAADAGSRAERHSAALRTKAFAGRLAAVGDTAIQVFGGIGYTWEHDAHLYLKRLLSWSAFLDGPDQCLVQIGAQFAESVLH